MLTRTIRPAAGPANRPPSTHRDWDTELLVLRGESREHLQAAVRATADDLRRHPDTDLTDLAFTLNSDLQPGGSRLAVVAATATEAATRLDRALERFEDSRCTEIRGASGLYYTSEPLYPGGKLAFLFPGEGAQYLGMLGDVRRAFPTWPPSSRNATRCARTQVTSARLSRRSSSRPRMPGPTTSPTPRKSCAGSTTPCSA